MPSMPFLNKLSITLLIIIIAITQQLQPLSQTISRAAELTNLIAEGKAPAITKLEISFTERLNNPNRLLKKSLLHFKNLTHLKLLGLHNLTSLDLTPLINLTNLNLTAISHLASLDLSPLTILTNLELNNMINLTNLDLSPLTSLTNLELNNMLSLTNLDLSRLTQLTYLKLGSLRLTNLDLSRLTNLTNLTLSDLNLANFDLSPLTSLTNLALNNMLNLTNLDLSRLTNLTNLTLSDLNLANFDLSPLTNLTNLTLSGLNLANLDLNPLTNLTDLTLNKIPTLTNLDLSILTSLTHLQIVNPLDGSLPNLNILPNLIHLKLEVFPNLTSIDFNGLTGLTYLELNSMPLLTNLDLSPLTNLTYLELANLPKLKTNHCLLPIHLPTKNIKINDCPELTDLIPNFVTRKKENQTLALIINRKSKTAPQTASALPGEIFSSIAAYTLGNNVQESILTEFFQDTAQTADESEQTANQPNTPATSLQVYGFPKGHNIYLDSLLAIALSKEYAASPQNPDSTWNDSANAITAQNAWLDVRSFCQKNNLKQYKPNAEQRINYWQVQIQQRQHREKQSQPNASFKQKIKGWFHL